MRGKLGYAFNTVTDACTLHLYGSIFSLLQMRLVRAITFSFRPKNGITFFFFLFLALMEGNLADVSVEEKRKKGSLFPFHPLFHCRPLISSGKEREKEVRNDAGCFSSHLSVPS